MIQKFAFSPYFEEKNFLEKNIKNFQKKFLIFFSKKWGIKSNFWIIRIVLNILKDIYTKIEVCILKNGWVYRLQSQKSIFCRKTVLKLERYMYLDTKRGTKNALIQATVGIFTFCKNLGNLWDLLYQNKQ